MAIDPKKRQKQLAKKTAKRKTLAAARKTFQKASKTWNAIHHMAVAVNSPIYECLVPENLFEKGLGNIIISRKMPNGFIGAGIFLLDVYCLGVKDCFFTVLPPEEYQNHLDRLSLLGSLEPIHPSCAVKLIQESAAYALNLGFKPHPDYELAKRIFGDLDPSVCPENFTFGQDGKPFFVSGPKETEQDIRRIMDTLQRRLGPDGFEYIVNMDNFEE